MYLFLLGLIVSAALGPRKPTNCSWHLLLPAICLWGKKENCVASPSCQIYSRIDALVKGRFCAELERAATSKAFSNVAEKNGSQVCRLRKPSSYRSFSSTDILPCHVNCHFRYNLIFGPLDLIYVLVHRVPRVCCISFGLRFWELFVYSTCEAYQVTLYC
uniref:Putative secreted protein n=1 Tax=Ixodes scapularis TaxID=6945 RepID=A0A4D5RYE9_IXOSC